ncbi:MAG: hypothetical protein JWO56_627 [Acidobacteria bacterium]|nr:hypothetical protein [Acidobacteriota bacterium]
MTERGILSEGSIYVSTGRVMINGTIYSTGNITSVRKTTTPAGTGGAVLLIVLGILIAVGGTISVFVDESSGRSIPAIVVGVALLAVGVAVFRSQKPSFQVTLVSAAGERASLTSPDEAVINRATIAIAEAMTSRD